MTNDLQRRVYEHKKKLVEGFTKKYNVNKLVYYEAFEDIENAILREKQIKGGSRAKKIKLIESINKEWKALYLNLYWFLMKISYSLGKYKIFQTAENSFPENARSYDDRREEFSCDYSGIFIKPAYSKRNFD